MEVLPTTNLPEKLESPSGPKRGMEGGCGRRSTPGQEEPWRGWRRRGEHMILFFRLSLSWLMHFSAMTLIVYDIVYVSCWRGGFGSIALQPINLSTFISSDFLLSKYKFNINIACCPSFLSSLSCIFCFTWVSCPFCPLKFDIWSKVWFTSKRRVVPPKWMNFSNGLWPPPLTLHFRKIIMHFFLQT